MLHHCFTQPTKWTKKQMDWLTCGPAGRSLRRCWIYIQRPAFFFNLLSSSPSAAGTACSSLPWLAVIFHGSCSFPSEALPSSSALVFSSRRRPPVLSTWSTTERNKEMTVHGEDDSRDPAARSNFVFSRWRRVSTGLCGTRGSSSPGFYFICLAHDQPSLFFSFLKMASQLFCFLQNNQHRPTCFSTPCWAGNLSRRGGMHFAQKMGYK